MPGDMIDLDVWCAYQAGSDYNTTYGLAAMINIQHSIIPIYDYSNIWIGDGREWRASRNDPVDHFRKPDCRALQ